MFNDTILDRVTSTNSPPFESTFARDFNPFDCKPTPLSCEYSFEWELALTITTRDELAVARKSLTSCDAAWKREKARATRITNERDRALAEALRWELAHKRAVEERDAARQQVNDLLDGLAAIRAVLKAHGIDTGGQPLDKVLDAALSARAKASGQEPGQGADVEAKEAQS